MTYSAGPGSVPESASLIGVINCFNDSSVRIRPRECFDLGVLDRVLLVPESEAQVDGRAHSVHLRSTDIIACFSEAVFEQFHHRIGRLCPRSLPCHYPAARQSISVVVVVTSR